MKSTRLMLLVVSMIASTFGATLLADSCCTSNNDCCTASSALNNSCCCDCCLACCEDCNDCCTTGTTNSSCDTCGGCAKSKDMLLPFSQSDNLARRYAGVAHLQNLADQEDWNWHFDVSVEYNQNFKRGLLGTYFFPNGTNRITVGEDTSISGSADVRGTDLGLSETFNGTLTICPKIQNAVFEPALYVGLDRWIEGLWFDIALPIAYTRWTLQACEITTSSGGLTFDPGNPGGSVGALSLQTTYTISENSMRNAGTASTLGLDPSNSSTVDRGQQTLVGARSISQALGGSAVWGDKTGTLQAGRFPINCPNNTTGVADIPFQLGYNFINRDRGYAGLYLRTVFPAGTIKNVRSMFNPVVGYGRFQFGGGLRAKARLWESDETSVNFFLDGYVTHIFAKNQCRVFDMCGRGAWSRYLLMKEADASGNYTGRLVNFVDMFTACVSSSFPWQADVLAFFNVQHKGWTWDVGYEFKGRACEKFDCDCISLCTPCDNSNLDCDESNDCGSCTGINNKIGNKQYGVKGPQFIGQIGDLVRDATDTTINKFGTQTTPVATGGTAAALQLINAGNFVNYLDLETTRIPQAISNKVWSHLGYTWADRDYPVAAGLGFEVDFGAKNRQPRVWGVWGKVTVAYN
jgi:hypothetical protein